MDNPVYDHRYLIIDQFTKQAVPFAKKSSQYIGEVFERIQTLLQPTENDIGTRRGLWHGLTNY